MVTLLLGMFIFAPVIHVCGSQAHFPQGSDINQDYDESIDVMYSSHENLNVKSAFPRYGVNAAGRKVQYITIITDRCTLAIHYIIKPIPCLSLSFMSYMNIGKYYKSNKCIILS